MIKTCASCRIQFKAIRKEHQTCSYKCGVLNRSGPKKKISVPVPCLVCGTRVNRTPYKTENRVFCSDNCHHMHDRQIGKFKGENNPNFKNSIRTYGCPTCKKFFKAYEKRRYCSYKCVMRINLKSAGTGLERKIRAILRESGYTVIRSAGSHTVVDLVAINAHHVRFIQAKRTSARDKKGNPYWNSFKVDMDGLLNMPCPEVCTREMWVWVKHRGWFKKVLNKSGEIYEWGIHPESDSQKAKP